MSFPLPVDQISVSQSDAAVVANASSGFGSLSAVTPQARSWLIIDSGVADAQTLIAGVTAGTEVYQLTAQQDGIEQITALLAGQQDIASLQIVSHGKSGGLRLGESWLDLPHLPRYVNQLKSWGQALTADADILLYGCNVAAGETGRSFVNLLAQATGADIAASDDLTGNAALGGNWDLEVQTGTIESTAGFSSDVNHYQYLLDTAVFAQAQQFSGGFLSTTKTVVDSQGNRYTTGSFSGTVDFDPGAGTTTLISNGGEDVFISKLDSSGNFVWAKAMGGTTKDTATELALDSSDNVYTAGYFTGTADFDPGIGVNNLVSTGDPDIFISKLDSNGNAIWAKSIGGANYESVSGLAVDSSGNVYTTGNFAGTVDFDPGLGVNNLASTMASYEIFISKLDSSGNFVWAKAIDGVTSSDLSIGLVVDSSGNIYTAGNFSGTVDFDPGTGVNNLTSAGGFDIFINKLDSSGNFVSAKHMGGTDNDFASGLAMDSSGSIYTTGRFSGAADFDPGTNVNNLISDNTTDLFISKLDRSGNFVWAKHMGGTGYANAIGLAVDSNNNVYTTGDFRGVVDFDPGMGVSNLTSAGGYDVFISKLSSSGNFVWAKSMGGSDTDSASGLAVDSSGNVYTTGGFNGTVDFDPGTGVNNLTKGGAFLSKLTTAGNFAQAQQFASGGLGGISKIVVDSSGNVYTTGNFSGTVDFDPGTGVYNLTSGGNADIFISKFDSSGNFVWAKSFGDGTAIGINGLVVDSSSNIYTTGFFTDTADFDPGTGVHNLTSAGRSDVFISKLDSSGNFVWAKRLGGENDDNVAELAVDSIGNVYATGNFAGTVDFDPGIGVNNLTTIGRFADLFISKLDRNGNFVWAKSLGGSAGIGSPGLAVDGSGNVYTSGYFQETVDFDPGTGVHNLISNGATSSLFISKLDRNGNFVWAKSLSGTGDIGANGLGLDSSGNIYVTGGFVGTIYFAPGAGVYSLASAGGIDIFISKLDSSGNFIWTKNMGGTGDDSASRLAVDNSGIYTAGVFFGTADFDPGAGVYNLSSAGRYDIFINRLDSSGKFVWAKSLGGENDDRVTGLAVDSSGNVYTSGSFRGTVDFDPGAGVYNLVTGGETNIFLSKLSQVAQAPRSEIFWRNPNGLEVIWQLDNTKLVNGVLINSPFNTPTWNLKGVADMDGDGIKDHIYQNATTFELRYLPFTTTNGQSPGVKAPVTPVFNNAAKFGTPGAIATPGGGWDLVGIEHVSGSAQADLIFYSRALDRLVFWETNATGQIVDAGFFTSTQSPGGQGTGAANAWSVQAVADFTGDGKVDFLWRNTAGVTVLWKVNGTVIDLAASQILPTMAPSFELRGVGDFNGDGIKDAVWRDQRANITRFWTFNTRGIATQTADNNAIVGAGFQIEAIADFNGDGKSDLIWRDPVSDRSVVWNFDLGANPGPVFQLSAVLPGSNYIRNFLPGVTDNVPVVNGDRAWDIDAASGI